MKEIEQTITDNGLGTNITNDIIKEIEAAKENGKRKLDGGPISYSRNLYEKNGVTEEEYNEYTNSLKDKVNDFIKSNENKIDCFINRNHLSDADCYDILMIILDVLKITKDNYFGVQVFHGTPFYKNLKSIVLNNINLFQGLEEVKFGFDPDLDYETVISLLEKHSTNMDKAKLDEVKKSF